LELNLRRSPASRARITVIGWISLHLRVVAIATIPTVVAAQSDLSAGPFAGFQSSGGTSTGLGGLSVLFGRSPIAARANAFTALGAQPLSASGIRPWGSEGAGILSLSGGSRLRGAFVFAGLGVGGRDSAGSIVTHPNWSYGAGYILPLGSSLDVMLENRNTVYALHWLNAAQGVRAVPQIRLGVSYHIPRSHTRNAASSNGPRGVGVPRGGSPARTPAAGRVLSTADDYLGVRYVWGGTSPSGGFDCSGFTQFVFDRNNVKLPRTSRQQAQVGTKLAASWASLAPGDLVMFAESGEAISHVAIYAGDGRIIHSTSSGGGVRYDDLMTQRGQWFARNMVAARRVLTNGQGIADFAKAFVNAAIVLDPPDKAPPVRR
jgi:cell wall-associated NlpC family hydrolase